MDSGLKGQHALITGASGGIGSATARVFAKEGVNLTLHYNTRKKNAEALAGELTDVKTSIIGADLSNEAETKKLFLQAQEQLGRIDILVANAGIWPEESVPIQKLSLNRWNKTIAIDLTSVFLCSREFFLNLECFPKNYASLVIIGSTAGVFGEAGHVDYATAKAGIIYGMVKSLKNEIVSLAKRGRVNAICPGWTRTRMASGALEDFKEVQKSLSTMPLQKIAKPEDIANMIVFLSSDQLSGHTSGEIITIAGGMEGRLLFPPK